MRHVDSHPILDGCVWRRSSEENQIADKKSNSVLLIYEQTTWIPRSTIATWHNNYLCCEVVVAGNETDIVSNNMTPPSETTISDIKNATDLCNAKYGL